uniref:NADH dehydrogenase [ubiquinone] 1 beta subcomplex subunit 9 n=1 Tax=Fibrocapsa japonica TaxID=94617 RepID=A0A7S2UV98_9STRA|mmetsp:Transcript_15149/g.22315  ORF Transcript_15149/g.22315 Transcript_15149/m.22315 type:complete len:155 (+) Transcript_15149:51-515(+)|eukprot:CAMPEP_0113943958 /NCGR_PEP_ID=MMETSP1339-20121228/29949_1 /TAXON_ID=94617 /ORGANISM="Fibrocapsa japonica" /LENGTH=154 /DNA_ID=CAMNT_0000948979 /DNA_START=51 /DNA_END=515 /DNA_ORIENTATION=- /assembly_acc=CAM_ASM_000762
MNEAFRKAAAQYRSVPEVLTHSQEVCRLYRNGLRLLFSWIGNRQVFNDEAEVLRARFDENKHLNPNSGKVKFLLQDAKKEIADMAHPDPYIAPYMPGGSMFMRNPAIPLEFCYPDGIPEGIHKEPLNIDMSPVRPGEKAAAGNVLVNSAGKSMS